jgi:hypothetical protein
MNRFDGIWYCTLESIFSIFAVLQEIRLKFGHSRGHHYSKTRKCRGRENPRRVDVRAVVIPHFCQSLHIFETLDHGQTVSPGKKNFIKSKCPFVVPRWCTPYPYSGCQQIHPIRDLSIQFEN